jgi:hypothetical protein
MPQFIRETPMQNPILGLLADRLKKAQEFGAKPFGYENPPVEMLMNLLGVPAVQQTMERMAYGEPLTTGSGMTTKPRAEAVEAAMTLLPASVGLAKATKGLPVGESIKNVGEELIYHGTSPKAAKAIEKSGFDVTKSADGTIWFTNNPNIGEVAATGKGAVVKRFLDEKKMKLGGWDETDKYSTDELIQKGFDGLKLKDSETGEITYQIFNPEKLSANKSYISPQQEALDTTQRNAALPIEEGLLATQSKQPMQGLLGQEVTDYRGSHQAPNREFGATLDDLTGGGEMYPADVYSPKGYQYYGTGNSYDKKAFDIANKFKGKPDAMVEIYRAVPKGVSDEINVGDWVTLTKEYALDHGEGPLKGDFKIIKKKVKASDIYTNADSIHEWGYDPQ